MRVIYVLLIVTQTGHSYEWRKTDDIYSCAGYAALEKMAQDHVLKKTGVNLKYQFICRRQ